MNDTFTITDDYTRETVTISFAQYYDLIISLDCASDLYGEIGDTFVGIDIVGCKGFSWTSIDTCST